VWFTLKDSGKTQVMSASPPFKILTTLETGPLTNHVTLIENEDGKFAYITVGGENVVKVFRRGEKPELVTIIKTGDLPHGIWGSGDGSRVYVGMENQDTMMAIDTHTNQVLATIPVGQQPQAVVYVPGAVPEGVGMKNLTPLGDAGKAAHLTLTGIPDGAGKSAKGTVSVNALGALDLLQLTITGLKPGENYEVSLVPSRTAPFGTKQLLATFKANAAGAQTVQTIGPLRHAVAPPENGGKFAAGEKLYLIVTEPLGGDALLVQDEVSSPAK
jgi:YVTN family beta-propeller protein